MESRSDWLSQLMSSLLLQIPSTSLNRASLHCLEYCRLANELGSRLMHDVRQRAMMIHVACFEVLVVMVGFRWLDDL